MIGSLLSGLIAKSGAENAAQTAAESGRYAADLANKQYLLSREDMSPWRYGGQNALQLLLMGTTGYGLPGTTGARSVAGGGGGVGGSGGASAPTGIGSMNMNGIDWTAANAVPGGSSLSGGMPGMNGANGQSPSLSPNLPISYDSPEANRNAFMSLFQSSPDYQFRLGEGIKALDRSAAARGMLGSGAQMKALQDYGQNTAAGEYNNWYNKLAQLAGYGQTATSNTAALGQQAAGQAGSALVSTGNQAGQLRASGYNNLASGVGKGFQNAFTFFGV